MKSISLPHSCPSSITLKLPSFHGDLPKWKDFWALFSSRLDKELELTDADRSCLLVEVMADTKARQRAETAIAHTTSYGEAVEVLHKQYKDNRLLFAYHYEELHQTDSIKDLENLDRVQDRSIPPSEVSKPPMVTQLANLLLLQWRRCCLQDFPGSGCSTPMMFQILPQLNIY